MPALNTSPLSKPLWKITAAMVTRESFIDNTILRIIPKKVIKSMQDKDDNTFLHLACMAKNKAVATIAIEAGCSATKK